MVKLTKNLSKGKRQMPKILNGQVDIAKSWEMYLIILKWVGLYLRDVEKTGSNLILSGQGENIIVREF